MWNGINPPSDLSLATTPTAIPKPRSWRSLSSRSIPQKSKDGQTTNTIVYINAIPETPTLPASVRPPSSWAIAIIILNHIGLLLLALVPLLFLTIVSLLPQWQTSTTNVQGGHFSHCNFDGAFTPSLAPTLSLWTSSGFFRISIFWGSVSFPKVKLIDIMWDIIVGRGGQAVLALATYKISNKVLTKTMETATVPYETFTAFAFVSPSLAKTANVGFDLLTSKGLQARATVVLLILSSLFVLAFPTLASAMSGYSNNLSAFLQLPDGNAVPWAEVHAVQFVINDAQRLGLPGSLMISVDSTCVFQGPGAGPMNSQYHPRDEDDRAVDKAFASVPAPCVPFWRTLQYIHDNGLQKVNQSSEYYYNGTGHDLEAPTLNITTTYDSRSLNLLLSTFDNLDSQTMPSLSSIPAYYSNTTWLYQNETYGYSYILTHGYCSPLSTHNWGFSFLILFLTTLGLAVWSLAMYAAWLDAHLHSKIDRQGRDVGPHRASWDLVHAMSNDETLSHIDRSAGDAAIRKSLRRRHCRTADRQSPTVRGVSYVDLVQETRSASTRWEEFKEWWFGAGIHRSLSLSSLSSFSISEKPQDLSVITTPITSFSNHNDRARSAVVHSSPLSPVSTVGVWSRTHFPSKGPDIFPSILSRKQSGNDTDDGIMEETNHRFRNDLGDD